MVLPIRTPTGHELSTCEMVHLTSEQPWEPSIIQDDNLNPEEYTSLCEHQLLTHAHYTWTKTQPHDIKQASKYLLHPGDEIVKKTLEATTQLGKQSQKSHLDLTTIPEIQS